MARRSMEVAIGWRVLCAEPARLRDSRRKRANNFAPLNDFDFTTLVPFTLLGKAFVIIFNLAHFLIYIVSYNCYNSNDEDVG